MTHWTLPTSASRSPSIAGRATFSAVKSLAITKTPSPIATSAITVPGWIASASCRVTSSSVSATVPPTCATLFRSSEAAGGDFSSDEARRRRSPSEKLVLAGEDLGDRVVGEDPADGVVEGLGGREDVDVVGGAVAERDRVGDDDLLDLRVLVGEPLEGGTAEDAVGRAGDDPGGALVEDGLGGGAEGAGGVDHVVDEDGRLALDVADDVTDLGDLLGRALLLHDRPMGADLAGEVAGGLDATGVGADDHELLVEMLVDEPLIEHRHRRHVVDGDLEEALDLAGMEVHGDDALGADRLERLGDDAGGDRLAGQGLLVLASVAVPGHHGDDPVRGGALGRVDHAEELHQRVVGRHFRRLVGRG